MATAQEINLSNYDTLLVQSSQGRAGVPDGNVFFDKSNGLAEFIRADEVATIDLSGGITTGPIQLNVVASAGTYTRLSGSFIDDGFKAGRSFAFSAFTNGGNNTTKVAAAVTDLVITVTDNTGLVDETGGGDEVAASVAEANPLTTLLGIKLEAFYAFENQERNLDETLRPYDRWTKGTFKFGGAYEFVNSKKPATAADRNILRASGWTEYASDGGIDRIYFGNLGLSNIEATSQPYYMLSTHASPVLNDLTTVNFAKQGNMNEGVQVFGSTANTPSDTGAYSGSVATAASQTISVVASALTFTRSAGSYLTDGFEPGHRFTPTGLANNTGIYTVDTVTALVITVKDDPKNPVTDETGNADEQLTVNGFDTRAYEAVSIRTFGKNFDRKETTNDQGILELGPYYTGFALNETDHLTTGTYALADVYGGGQIAPWTGMTLEKLAVATNKDEFAEAAGNFTWVLNNTGNGNLNQMVAFLDALAQTTDDIDSGTETITYGKNVGTWYYYNATGQVVTRSGADSLGLYLYNVPVADQQGVVMTDDAAALKTYSFTVSVEAEIGANAKADILAWYHSYFAANYNTASAVPVQDSTATEVKGAASTANAQNKIIFGFDYTGDTVGGPADTDKDCVFLCEGDGGVTQAKTLYTITKQTTVAFACIPGVETNA